MQTILKASEKKMETKLDKLSVSLNSTLDKKIHVLSNKMRNAGEGLPAADGEAAEDGADKEN
jgi:outer membrane murein-binding lipoprotein Lpp